MPLWLLILLALLGVVLVLMLTVSGVALLLRRRRLEVKKATETVRRRLSDG